MFNLENFLDKNEKLELPEEISIEIKIPEEECKEKSDQDGKIVIYFCSNI